MKKKKEPVLSSPDEPRMGQVVDISPSDVAEMAQDLGFLELPRAQVARDADLVLAAADTSGSVKKKNPHQVWREETDRVIEELRQGIIPHYCMEEYRLVPPESPEGAKFNEILQQVVRKFYKEPKRGRTKNLLEYLSQHDFDAEPVRFMLSDSPEANAFSVRHSCPPLIVFNKGLFKEMTFVREDGTQVKERIINTPDEFCCLLGHEMTHAKLGIKYGHDRENSKFEESTAEGMPPILLHAAKRNPTCALWVSRKMHQMVSQLKREQKAESVLREVIDEHPMARTEKSVIEASLSGIRATYGDFSQLKPAPVFTPESPLMRVVSQAKSKSYVDERLPKDYESRSPYEKFLVLKELVLGLDAFYPARLSALASALFGLEGKVEPAAVSSLVDECADFIFEQAEGFGIQTFSRLYYSLSSLVYPNMPSRRPLGRLKKIADATRSFVDAASNENNEALDAAAHELVVALKSEPIAADREGNEFLKSIHWPQFVLPAGIEDYKGGSISTVLPVSWAPVLARAEQNEEVLLAGIALGIPFSPNLMTLKPDAPSTSVLFYHFARDIMGYGRLDDLFEGSYSFSPFSSGPLTSKGKKCVLDIHRLSIDAKGRPLGFISSESYESYLKKRCLQYVIHALQAVNTQLKSLSLDEDEERELKKKRKLLIDMLKYSGRNKHAVIGEELFENEFELFFSINNVADPMVGAHLIGKIIHECKKEPKRTMVRNLFGINPQIPGGFIDSSFVNEPGLLGMDIKMSDHTLEDDVAWEEKRPHIAEDIHPIHQLLFKDTGTFFTPQEKVGILNLRLGSCVRVDEMGTSAHSIGLKKKHIPEIIMCHESAATVLPYANACAQAAGLPTVSNVASIKGLTKIVNTYAAAPNSGLFMMWLCCLRLATMFEKNNPPLSELGDFLSVVSPHLDVGYLREAFKDHVNSALEKNISQAPVAAAITRWGGFQEQKYLDAGVSRNALECIVDRIKSEPVSDQVVYIKNLLEDRYILSTAALTEAVSLLIDAVVSVIGVDDGTDAYKEKVRPIVEWVVNQTKKPYHTIILSQLAKKTVAQADTTYELHQALPKVKKEDLSARTAALGVGAEGLIKLARYDSENQKDILRFLSGTFDEKLALKLHDKVVGFTDSGLKQERLDEASARIDEEYGKDPKFDQKKEKKLMEKIHASALAFMRQIHDNFWSMPFVMRTGFFKELMIVDDESLVDDPLITMVCDLIFKGHGEQERYVREYIRAYIAVSPSFAQMLTLSAIVAAAEKNQGEQIPLGQAIALVAEKVGPAETKVVQIAEGHPDVPVELRKDLGRLKYAADEPERWDIHEQIDGIEAELIASYEQMTGQQGITIVNRGRVLGSGSLFVAIEITLSDGTEHVLALQRPYALERGRTGFQSLADSIDELGPSHPIVGTLKDIMTMAHQRLDVETDCSIAKLQYDAAYDMYRGEAIVVDGLTVTTASPRLTAHGEKFFLMEKMQGTHFAQLPDATPEEVAHINVMARALVTKELCQIFRGRFDSDRHGGNVRVSDFALNHFDFKGMSIQNPTAENLDHAAHIFTRGFEKLVMGEDLLPALLKAQREHHEQTGISDTYVGEMIKALVSLGEYVRLMTQDQRVEVFVAALQACRYEPFVKILQEKIPMLTHLMDMPAGSVHIIPNTPHV